MTMISLVRTDGIAWEKIALQIVLSRNNASFSMIVPLSFVSGKFNANWNGTGKETDAVLRYALQEKT